jgi:hypothetical protein
MPHQHLQQKMRSLWSQLYGDRDVHKLEPLFNELDEAYRQAPAAPPAEWYRTHKAFGRGTLRFIDVENDHALAYLREHEGERVLLLQNLSSGPRRAAVRERSSEWRKIYGAGAFDDGRLTLPAQGFGWFIG